MKSGETPPIASDFVKVLRMIGHELSTPLGTISGNLRLLEALGPLGEKQRRVVEQIRGTCGQLSQLLNDVRELQALESGEAKYNRGPLDLAAVLTAVITSLPENPSGPMPVALATDETFEVRGDAVKLKSALASLLYALRREVVGSDRLAARLSAGPDRRLTIAEPDLLDALRVLPTTSLSPFNEFRGGTGLRLPNARRILASHGATLWSPVDGSKASAIITFGSAPTS